MARFLQWLLIAVCLVSVAFSIPAKPKAGIKHILKRQASSYGDTFYCPGETYSHPISWICDGYSDCYDGYDEIGCDYDSSMDTWNDPYPTIPPYYHSTGDIWTGYDPSWNTWSDYNSDWSTWSDYYQTSTPYYDENNWSNWGSCSYGEIQCLSGACSPVDYVCDGYEDCSKGEDELFCPDYTSMVNDYYKKQAGKRNLGKKIDDKVLKAKVYHELRNHHAKGEMKKGKQVKRVRERKLDRTNEEDLKRLMANINEKLKQRSGKKPSNKKIIK